MTKNYKRVIHLLLTILTFISSHLNGIEIVGNGWHSPQLIFNSRYFFVKNKSVNKLLITSPDSGCRVWHQVLNETNFGENNFTIFRYKLLNDICLGGIEMQLIGGQTGDEVLAKKVVVEDIYSENCICRRNDWHKLMNCHQMKQQFIQIDSDLSTFNASDGIDFDLVLNEMKRRFAPHTRSYSFCHYQIINNEAYRNCYGEYVGFSQFMDEIIESLLKKTYIPDIEFIANLGDWPLSHKGVEPPLPIFSWCGSLDTNDIVIPTYELTESSLHMQGRISLDILSVFGKQSIKFNDKKDVLFWRGRDSNEVRLKLVKMAKNYTDLINASLTNFFFFRDQIEEYGPQSPYISFFDFFEYKYQMNIDGTVAAYRLPYLLAGSSLVFKQDSKYYEFFYNLLKPNVHYIHVDKELNNLIEIINYLSENNQQIEQIIHNSRSFVLENLLPEHIYCYHFNLFNKYAKLLKNKVQLRPEMVKVSKDDNKCNCKHNLLIKEEL